MTEDLDAPGAHRAVRLRVRAGDPPNRFNSAAGLAAAAVLGICSMLVVIVLGGAAGGQGAPPPVAAPTAPNADEARMPDDPGPEPPQIEFSMSAWPTESPTRSPAASTSPTRPATGVSPSPSARTTRADPPEPPPPPPSPTPPPVTYTAVAGYGCPGGATHTFSEVGRYTNGQIGWYAVSSGAWTGNGCTGRFDAMEMSGYATVDDPEAHALWTFAVGSASKRCQISVYVPSSSNTRDVAGKPAQYFVLDTETGPVRASFTVDQRYNRGKWMTGGTHAVSGGKLVVKLVNRGEDWTFDGPTYEHIAIAQVRLTCTR